MSDVSHEKANQIVSAALAKGRELDLQPLSVAVLDSGGHLKAFGREDGSGILRPQICFGKAYGALGIGAGTRVLASRVEQGPGHQAFVNALGPLSDGRVVPAAGGVLIRDQGAVIGAVGVTGDASERDEACAIAGIEVAEFTARPGLGPDESKLFGAR